VFPGFRTDRRRIGAVRRGQWPRSFTIVEEEAEAIHRAFVLRSQDMSLRKIAKRLNDDGLRPRQRRSSTTGKPIPHKLGSGAISLYLTDTAYRGDPVVRDIAPRDRAPAEAFDGQQSIHITVTVAVELVDRQDQSRLCFHRLAEGLVTERSA